MDIRGKVFFSALIQVFIVSGCENNPSTQSSSEMTSSTPSATKTTQPSPTPTEPPFTDTPELVTNTPELPTETPQPTPTPDVPYEIVTFETEDGVEIAATLLGEGDTALLMLHK